MVACRIIVLSPGPGLCLFVCLFCLFVEWTWTGHGPGPAIAIKTLAALKLKIVSLEILMTE